MNMFHKESKSKNIFFWGGGMGGGVGGGVDGWTDE